MLYQLKIDIVNIVGLTFWIFNFFLTKLYREGIGLRKIDGVSLDKL